LLIRGGAVGDADGLNWTRSSRCSNNACVEVAIANAEGDVLVRDAKDPRGPTLRFDSVEWHAFLAGARVGEFDLSSLA
jgi:hypothetical protein